MDKKLKSKIIGWGIAFVIFMVFKGLFEYFFEPSKQDIDAATNKYSTLAPDTKNQDTMWHTTNMKGLILRTPVVLGIDTALKPASYLSPLLVDSLGYDAFDSDKGLYIAAYYFKFSPRIDSFSIMDGANGAILSMKAKSDPDNFYYTINSYRRLKCEKAVLTMGSFTKNKLPVNFEDLILNNKNEVWSVIVLNYNPKNYPATNVDRIINSASFSPLKQ